MLPSSVAERLETRSALLRPWRKRCEHLLVDETQDVDRSQLRLALLLAAPDNRIFLVGGDDDQKIYGWRLADERRHPVAGRWHGYDLTVALCCGPVTTHASW